MLSAESMLALAEDKAVSRGYLIQSGKMYGWGITRKELIGLYAEQGFPLKDGTPCGMDSHIASWVESNDVVRIGTIQDTSPKCHYEGDGRIVIDRPGPVPRFAPIDDRLRGAILFFRPSEDEYRKWERERILEYPDNTSQTELFDRVEYVVIRPKSMIDGTLKEPEFHWLNGRTERTKADADMGILGAVYR